MCAGSFFRFSIFGSKWAEIKFRAFTLTVIDPMAVGVQIARFLGFFNSRVRRTVFVFVAAGQGDLGVSVWKSIYMFALI